MIRKIGSVAFFAFYLSFAGFAQSVVNTVHNLSVNGPGDIRAVDEQEVCIFCHTPHHSRPDSPLWNKDDPGVIYSLYTSSTTQAVPGQPGGSSILCLSCHDGTIALGNVMSRSIDINFTGSVTHLPPGTTNLGSDLSNDHPISFQYTSALAAMDGQLLDPALISYPVALEEEYVQCTSCHDPHKDLFPDFLVASNQFSELCLKCHNRDYWSASSHHLSTANWNGTGNDPWFHTEFSSVAENGCENCHNPHNAEGEEALKNWLVEEANCLGCHNGNVAATNIEMQISKPYTHNVYGYSQDHEPGEDALVTNMHVECEDCHNPHATNNTPGIPPEISGEQTGVKGVTLAGTMIETSIYQYEICFRCHGDSPGKPTGTIVRSIEQYNTRLEFSPSNPSYHPVAAAGQNPNVPSLIGPEYSESSMIYCSDCHSSDGATAPAGPHGSSWQFLLKYRYETADNTVESAETYALCYSCHSRTSILADETFPYHRRHIVEENSPCSSCHDSHGISSTQGTNTNNTHLINFDLSIVQISGSGVARFVDTGFESGYCQIRCHDKGHGIGMGY